MKGKRVLLLMLALLIAACAPALALGRNAENDKSGLYSTPQKPAATATPTPGTAPVTPQTGEGLFVPETVVDAYMVNLEEICGAETAALFGVEQSTYSSDGGEIWYDNYANLGMGVDSLALIFTAADPRSPATNIDYCYFAEPSTELDEILPAYLQTIVDLTGETGFYDWAIDNRSEYDRYECDLFSASVLSDEEAFMIFITVY